MSKTRNTKRNIEYQGNGMDATGVENHVISVGKNKFHLGCCNFALFLLHPLPTEGVRIDNDRQLITFHPLTIDRPC